MVRSTVPDALGDPSTSVPPIATPFYMLCAAMTASPKDMTEKSNTSGRKAQVEAGTVSLVDAFLDDLTGTHVGVFVGGLTGACVGALVVCLQTVMTILTFKFA
jgi:hypothetical protein